MTRRAWTPDENRPAVCVHCGERLTAHYVRAVELHIQNEYYPCPDTPPIVDVPL